MDMDSVLNGDVEETVEKTEDTTEATGETEDVKTDEVKTEPEKEAPPASHTEGTVPRAALEEQRNRRRFVEKQRDDLQAKLDSQQNTETTSVFDNEAKFVQELEAKLDKRLLSATLDISQLHVEKDIGKEALDQKIDQYKLLAEKNPELNTRCRTSPSFYAELVNVVDQHQAMEEMGNITDYKAKLKAEVKAELEAEQQGKTDDKAKLRDSIPNSLVDESSAGTNKTQGPKDLPSVEDIFNTS